MSVATINTFPPVHTFNSSRSWAMAIIVLLHLGFFWALTSGMAVSMQRILIGSSDAFVVPEDDTQKRPPPKPIDPDVKPTYVPIISDYVPTFDPAESTNDIHPEIQRTPARTEPATPKPAPVPVMVEPQVDPRIGLSEPVYPSSDIRMGNEGTVILSLQILENGRVGEVRIERSSGFERLDSSAVREARRWRFRPGTRDGVPVVMWKQLPVTFQLQQ
jgi:periplasmic protein TonB